MDHGHVNPDIAQALKELRVRIERENIPSSALDETINVATWNIREFGKKPRTEAAIHLIPEILYQFEVIAITELRTDLGDLRRVMQILGPYWRVVFSDFTPDRGGNYERVGYLYDKRAVVFTGLAAEADAPRKKDHATGEYLPVLDWWRAPYLASFRAGTFDFILLSAHIRWGSSEAQRATPLKLLADWIHKRFTRDDVYDTDIIVMGDFNIPSVSESDALFAAITSRGLRIPRALAQQTFGTNLSQKKRYDQILHYPQNTKNFTDYGGVLDFFQGDHEALIPGISKTDFTYQLSDHLPLWMQIDGNRDDERLDQILRAREPD